MPTVDLGLVVGSNGQGVPTGGSAGQILAKKSSSNYDTGWVPMSAAAAAAFGIVENGNTASQTIAAGQYVIWKGVLYTADAAIASGTTLAASGGNKNLTATPNGGLNDLNSKFAHVPAYATFAIPQDSQTTYTFAADCAFTLQTVKVNSTSTSSNGFYIGQAHNAGVIIAVQESSVVTVSISGRVLTLGGSTTNLRGIITIYNY